jgi:hypothetical protein
MAIRSLVVERLISLLGGAARGATQTRSARTETMNGGPIPVMPSEFSLALALRAACIVLTVLNISAYLSCCSA